MNPGNNKPSQWLKIIDNFIEYLNKKFAKVLGKKEDSKKPQKTSGLAFVIIILLSSVVLWISTGFYYLADNEYGLILVDGKVDSEARGLKFGFTLPYPFGDVDILDISQSKSLTIGASSPNQHDFVVLDKNLSPFAVIAKFNYQITNPRLFYINYLRQDSEFNDEVVWNTQSKIRNIIANTDLSSLKTTNYTVLSNQILNSLNTQMALYGITIVKLDIVTIKPMSDQITVANNISGADDESSAISQKPLAFRLKKSAKEYYDNNIAMAMSESKEFNELLLSYRHNPLKTVEQMYNASLNRIPLAHNGDDNALIFLPLEQLKQMESQSHSYGEIDNTRTVIREVNRDRSWVD